MSDLYTELMSIKEKRGALTPRIVAEEAKPRNHPLHTKVYDVPQKEAADRYYLNNARKLLQITFRHTFDDGRTSDLRHFWPVRGTEDNPETKWEPTEEIVQDPVLYQLKVREMMREWKRFKARYQDFVEFAEMIRSDPDMFDPDEEFGDDDGDGTNG